MHLAYQEQLKMKRDRVINALERIGHFRGVAVDECHPSPVQFGYRNKIQLPLQEGRLGLYERGSHTLVPIEHCLIHSPAGDLVYSQIKAVVETLPLRHLLIKSGEGVLVTLVAYEESPLFVAAAKKMMELAPAIQGVVLNINKKPTNVILGDIYIPLAGIPFIFETICGLHFKVSPASFFQVNPRQAEKLYQTAISLAELQKSDKVLDGYCGVGTLTLLLAREVATVTGVELVADAIADAKENAKRNEINNVEFHCSPLEKALQQFKERDVVFLNPPRKGCEEAVLHQLEKVQPNKIIYISCDPATLARDLAHLTSYNIKRVVPFDMFPETAHVETVTLLEKK